MATPQPAWAYWRTNTTRHTTYHAPVRHTTYHAPVRHTTYRTPVRHQTVHAAPAHTASRTSGGFFSHLVHAITATVHHVTQAIAHTVQHASRAVSAWYQRGVQRANQSVTTAFGANGQKNAVDAHTGRILTTNGEPRAGTTLSRSCRDGTSHRSSRRQPLPTGIV